MALKRPPVLAALAAFIIVSALPAQEGGLTLDRAVELALAGHPEIREAQARVEAARGRTLQFASRPEPQLTAGLEGIPLPGLKKDEAEALKWCLLAAKRGWPGSEQAGSKLLRGMTGHQIVQAQDRADACANQYWQTAELLMTPMPPP